MVGAYLKEEFSSTFKLTNFMGSLILISVPHYFYFVKDCCFESFKFYFIFKFMAVGFWLRLKLISLVKNHPILRLRYFIVLIVNLIHLLVNSM